jgi:hypothetical protein
LMSSRGPAVRWLRRAGSLFYRVIYGKDRYVESWTFPPRSLRTAREALGLDAQQAYELAGRPFSELGGWEHVLHWSGMESSKKPIRCTHVKLAVLISTGMAVHARAAGSGRALAELILFGPAPLSHYPPITPVRRRDLDDHDFRRIMDACQRHSNLDPLSASRAGVRIHAPSTTPTKCCAPPTAAEIPRHHRGARPATCRVSRRAGAVVGQLIRAAPGISSRCGFGSWP